MSPSSWSARVVKRADTFRGNIHFPFEWNWLSYFSQNVYIAFFCLMSLLSKWFLCGSNYMTDNENEDIDNDRIGGKMSNFSLSATFFHFFFLLFSVVLHKQMVAVVIKCNNFCSIQNQRMTIFFALISNKNVGHHRRTAFARDAKHVPLFPLFFLPSSFSRSFFFFNQLICIFWSFSILYPNAYFPFYHLIYDWIERVRHWQYLLSSLT